MFSGPVVRVRAWVKWKSREEEDWASWRKVKMRWSEETQGLWCVMGPPSVISCTSQGLLVALCAGALCTRPNCNERK